jgi:hypothetical protein
MAVQGLYIGMTPLFEGSSACVCIFVFVSTYEDAIDVELH